MHQTMLIGNLGNDPETRYLDSGTSITTFSVAVNERWKGKDGSQQERVEWYNIQCWGRLAEIAAEYLSKGSKVYVQGRNVTSSWDDKETGQKRYRTELRADNIEFLTPRSEQQAAAPKRQEAAPKENWEEDVPF